MPVKSIELSEDGFVFESKHPELTVEGRVRRHDRSGSASGGRRIETDRPSPS